MKRNGAAILIHRVAKPKLTRIRQHEEYKHAGVFKARFNPWDAVTADFPSIKRVWVRSEYIYVVEISTQLSLPKSTNRVQF